MNNENKIILDLCGGTGAWSRPYKEAGYDVKVITVPDFDVRDWYAIGYDLIFKNQTGGDSIVVKLDDIYGILAAPPCTMFSDARTNAKTPRDLEGGWEIVEACLKIIRYCQFNTKSDQQKLSPLKFWALENPWYGRLKWFMGNPVYIFDPWEFGDAYKKRTAIWGYFKEPIKTVLAISEEDEGLMRHKSNRGKPREIWANWAKDGKSMKKFDYLKMEELKKLKGVNNSEYWKQTNLRQTLRSITPAGFAEAFFKANL